MSSKRTVYALAALVVALFSLYAYSLGDRAILLADLLVLPVTLLLGCGLLMVLARLLARIEEIRLLRQRDS